MDLDGKTPRKTHEDALRPGALHPSGLWRSGNECFCPQRIRRGSAMDVKHVALNHKRSPPLTKDGRLDSDVTGWSQYRFQE